MSEHYIKKTIVLLIGALVMILFSVGIYIFINSDYFKSRKVVDTDWMIGKTIDEIAHRYSYPPDSLEAYMVDHTPYVLCAREIFLYDSWDGMQGQYMYYVLLDDNGKVVDVKIDIFGGDLPPEEYDYNDRW
ncbi:MAG: hypothetical protein IKR23_03790 [Lachnospiraceae bacterium]|nr:hypothetical protein [Lachnospiraceae bacterium]